MVFSDRFIHYYNLGSKCTGPALPLISLLEKSSNRIIGSGDIVYLVYQPCSRKDQTGQQVTKRRGLPPACGAGMPANESTLDDWNEWTNIYMVYLYDGAHCFPLIGVTASSVQWLPKRYSASARGLGDFLLLPLKVAGSTS